MSHRRFMITLCLALTLAALPTMGTAAPADDESFPPRALLEKLAPRHFIKMLGAYAATLAEREKNPRVKIPLVTFLLDEGHKLTGVVTRIDFDHNRFTLMLEGDRFRINVAFLEFKQVETFILHDIDLYPEFLENLQRQ